MAEKECTITTTAKEYMDALQEVIDKRDFTARRQICTPDCVFTLAPASILQENNMPADFSMNNEMFEAHMKNQFDVLESASIEDIDVVPGPFVRKAVVHHRNHIKLVNGDTSTLENAVFLYMTEDGKKVKKIIEFTDVVETKKYLGKLAEAKEFLENKGKA